MCQWFALQGKTMQAQERMWQTKHTLLKEPLVLVHIPPQRGYFAWVATYMLNYQEKKKKKKSNAVFHSAEHLSAAAARAAVKLQPRGTRPVYSSERRVEGEGEHRGGDA